MNSQYAIFVACTRDFLKALFVIARRVTRKNSNMTNLIEKPDVQALSRDTKDVKYWIHLHLYGSLGVVALVVYGPTETTQPNTLKVVHDI